MIGNKDHESDTSVSISDYRSYYSQVNFDPKKKQISQPSPGTELQETVKPNSSRDIKEEARILKEFFEKFDIELIEEVVS